MYSTKKVKVQILLRYTRNETEKCIPKKVSYGQLGQLDLNLFTFDPIQLALLVWIWDFLIWPVGSVCINLRNSQLAIWNTSWVSWYRSEKFSVVQLGQLVLIGKQFSWYRIKKFSVGWLGHLVLQNTIQLGQLEYIL